MQVGPGIVLGGASLHRPGMAPERILHDEPRKEEDMRVMLLVEMDTAISNRLVTEGKMGTVIEGILCKLIP